MRVPNDFWDSNYYDHPSLTDKMVVAAEKELQVKLPAEYISLLKVQNGGYTKPFGFPMKQRTSWAANHVPLESLSGIVPEGVKDTPLSILKSAYMTQEWGLPPHQVLLSGDGHWWITLDYRKRTVPCVTWIDVECNEDVLIAPSFKAFIEGLKPAADFEE